MQLYADQPARRTRQILGDVLVVLWVIAWVAVGLAVHDAVAQLAAPGRTLEDAGTTLSQGLGDAGSGLAGIPLLGEELGAPFDAAGDAADGLARAGADLQRGVATAALLAGTAVAAWPILTVVALWLWRRIRFARRAATARALLAGGAGVDLFALRALTRLPLHALTAVSADPAGDWRRGDPAVVHRLAGLALSEAGVRLPAPVAGISPRR